ncbi:MAG: magnesium transporter CorA family protein [Lachnospirales bacterium]
MLEIFKSSKNGELNEVKEIENNCWINMIAPTYEEIEHVALNLDLDVDFIRAPLDEEERSRIEIDGETRHGVIIIDTPVEETGMETKIIETYPLGIIHTDKCIITVSLKENPILNRFARGGVKTFITFKKTRFILQILYNNTTLYLHYLKHINKLSTRIEDELQKTMRNAELMRLLDLEKSLVYINTSLKSNELVFEKLIRVEFIDRFEEDKELIEDIIIENKQAIEMATIYASILSETRDAFSSVISNNANNIMKLLAFITLIMSIPTVVSGFFGMNVIIPNAFSGDDAFLHIFIMTCIICVIVTIVMMIKKLL